MDPLALRVAERYLRAKGNFIQRHKDQWQGRVQYADGTTHNWWIKQLANGKFIAEVLTPGGRHKSKKEFDDFASAERFADKFIEKAHGQDLLKKALPSEFTAA